MPESDPLRRPIANSQEEAESDENGPIDPGSNVAAFRISVDLSEYFQQDASCFLWVPRPRDTRTVRWLARRLRHTAALRERFCLLCDTHTLPPDEPLRLLRPGDALRVVRAEHEWQRVFSFRGERAPPAPPPKTKKRRTIETVPTEPPTAMPKSKPTQELASVPKAKSSLPPPEPSLPRFSPPTFSPAVTLPPSVPTTSSVSITNSPCPYEEIKQLLREYVPPISPPKTKKRRTIETVPTEPPTAMTKSKPTQELASVPKAKSSLSPPEPSLLRFSPPTFSLETFKQFLRERAAPISPPKTKKRRAIDTAPTEPSTPFVPQSKPTQELASVPKAKPSLAPPEPLLPQFTLPTFLPALPKPPSVQPTTSSVASTKSPSQDNELQRVKCRALELLRKVEGEFSRGQEREKEVGEDETDGAGNEWPAKKRRRRVRRRRALPPVDFEQELILSTTKSSNPGLPATPELSLTPAIPTTPVTNVLEPSNLASPPLSVHPSILTSPTLSTQPSILASPALPTQPSVLASPSIPMLSLSLAAPSPVVLRGETTPRLPRLIRALDATRSEDIGQASQEQNAPTAPAPLPHTAVQCS